jgi:hypothetical protein
MFIVGLAATMRFLFVTLQYIESAFYGEVALELTARGHHAAMVSYSRRAASKLRRHGLTAYSVRERLGEIGGADPDPRLVAETERAYALPTLRDVYRTDVACRGHGEAWSGERTIRHFQAVERIFDLERPDVVFLDVGGETIRTAAHRVARRREVTVLFPFYTIFPRPLRLYANTMHAPIVTNEEIRALAVDEGAEVDAFVHDFIERNRPIREYRRTPTLQTHWRNLVRHTLVRAALDRDNEYLRPGRWIKGFAAEAVRRRAARALYRAPRPDRPFVYFPLHVADDYKIARVIPHCSDQAAIIQQVAAYLPAGYDLVTKEHPQAIGRTSLSVLRRIARVSNVRLVAPHTSSHDLIRDAAGVVVISSTVGLEALLHAKPVLTIGQPFYAGAGITLDVDSFAELPQLVPQLLRFRPDHERIRRFLGAAMRRCHPGRPVLVDRSYENALVLAGTLDRLARLESAAGIKHVVEETSAR